MKVKELIAKLSELDQELEVVMFDAFGYDSGYADGFADGSEGV